MNDVNDQRPTLPNGKTNDVDAAKLEVARAERALAESLHDASDAGIATLERAVVVARPLLLGALAVLGVAVIVRSIRRTRQPAWRRPPPSERSVFAEVARAAALSLASTAARRLADRYLSDPTGMQSTSAGRAGSPHLSAGTR